MKWFNGTSVTRHLKITPACSHRLRNAFRRSADAHGWLTLAELFKYLQFHSKPLERYRAPTTCWPCSHGAFRRGAVRLRQESPRINKQTLCPSQPGSPQRCAGLEGMERWFER